MATIQFTDRATAGRISAESQALARAAYTARGAPAVLGSHLWRWRVDGRVLGLRADRPHHGGGPEPDNRMLTVGAGIALHHARTALIAAGVQADVRYQPDPADADLLATIIHGGALAPGPEAARLHRAIARRVSDQRPSGSAPVPGRTLERLRAAANSAGAGVHLAAGTDLGWLTPSVEVTGWYAIVHTEDDTVADWLAGGEATSAILLTAVADGLATSVTSALVAAPAERATLRRALPGLGYPTLVLRVGVPALAAAADRPV
jgi:hypothetical protein